MRIRYILFITVVVIGAMTAQLTEGAVKKRDPRFSQAATKEFARREKNIRAELATLKNDEWAGEFYYDNHLSKIVHIVLAPKSGFVYTSASHQGLYDRNYGEIVRSKDSIKLLFKFPNGQDGYTWVSEEMIPVRWGELHYLIPSHRMIDFCNAINAGIEPPGKRRSANGEIFVDRLLSDSLLRAGDETKNALGAPEIPASFLEYLLEKPVETSITSVGEARTEKEKNSDLIDRYTKVTVGVGYAEGVRRGMEFFALDSSGRFDFVEIDEVSEHTSSAIIHQVFFSVPDRVPVVGVKVTSCFVKACNGAKVR